MTDISEILQSHDVFSDAKKGFHASESKLQEVFGTNDQLEVAKIILKEGEIQFNQEYRDKPYPLHHLYCF